MINLLWFVFFTDAIPEKKEMTAAIRQLQRSWDRLLYPYAFRNARFAEQKPKIRAMSITLISIIMLANVRLCM